MDRKCERFRPLVLRLAELDIETIAPHAMADRDSALAFCLLLDQMPRNLFRQDTDAEGLGRICFGSVLDIEIVRGLMAQADGSARTRAGQGSHRRERFRRRLWTRSPAESDLLHPAARSLRGSGRPEGGCRALRGHLQARPAGNAGAGGAAVASWTAAPRAHRALRSVRC